MTRGSPRPRHGTEAKAKFYVFEMKKRKPNEPLRQVSSGPLPKREAQMFARIGAKEGKHDRVVTTSPRGRGRFEVLGRFGAGTGEKVRGRKK